MGIGMYNSKTASFGFNSPLSFGQAMLLQHSAYQAAKRDADKRFAEEEDSENKRIAAVLGASNQLQAEIAQTGEILEAGFEGLSVTIHESSKALGAYFNYGIGLIVDELRDHETVQLEIAEELASIHEALRTPLKVQITEYIGKGFHLLSRGLPDKALDVFIKVLELDETNIMAQFQAGRIFLYGIVDETTSLIDLEQAGIHLQASRRYASAELKHTSDVLDFYLEICFTLGVACYARAVDLKKSGNIIEAQEACRRALELFIEVEDADNTFYAAIYQKILCKKFLGQPDYMMGLEELASYDKNYYLKIISDIEFVDDVEQLRQCLKNEKDKNCAKLAQGVIRSYKELKVEYLMCDGLPDAEYSNICAEWAMILDSMLLEPFETYVAAEIQDCINPGPSDAYEPITLFHEDAFSSKADLLIKHYFDDGGLVKEIRKKKQGKRALTGCKTLLSKTEREALKDRNDKGLAETSMKEEQKKMLEENAKLEPDLYYSLGQEHAGGIIFYLGGKEHILKSEYTQQDGLVCSLLPQTRNVTWVKPKTLFLDAKRIDIKTGTAVGTGRANTAAIIAAQGRGSYAAQVCDDLVSGSFDDWFLPSKDELDLMYKNLKKAGIGGFGEYSVSNLPPIPGETCHPFRG